MDGANMNALVGVARPGDMGVDVIHLNLHKTFSTPHGGGGPGLRAMLCSAELEAVPAGAACRKRTATRSVLNYDVPTVDRPRKSVLRQFRDDGPCAFLHLHARCRRPEGGDRSRRSERPIPVAIARRTTTTNRTRPTACTRSIFSHKNQSKKGVHTLDIAKRLIDYGFHPMTIYFPLVVEGAMLIEPTESVGRADLDAFVEAMIDIDREAQEDPQLVIDAPAFDPHRPPRRSGGGTKTGAAGGSLRSMPWEQVNKFPIPGFSAGDRSRKNDCPLFILDI